mmetsp:Transcript_26982/g.54202  ORF Transcript_26982/g.54202 Transcript_26982/m.54202 type:complete len:915 (-) Transcript_26982:21-2765(-)
MQTLFKAFMTMTETTMNHLLSLDAASGDGSTTNDDTSACSHDISVKTYPVALDYSALRSSRGFHHVAPSTKKAKKERTKRTNGVFSVIDNDGKMTAFEYLYMSKTGKPLERSSELGQSDEMKFIRSHSKPKIFASEAANNYYRGVLAESFEEASEANDETEEVDVLSLNVTVDSATEVPSSVNGSIMKKAAPSEDSNRENVSQIDDLVIRNDVEEEDNAAEEYTSSSSIVPSPHEMRSEDQTNAASNSAGKVLGTNPEDKAITASGLDDSDPKPREQFLIDADDADEASAIGSVYGSVRSIHNEDEQKVASRYADDSSAQGSVRSTGSKKQIDDNFDVDDASAKGSISCSVRSVRSNKHEGFSKNADYASAIGSVRSAYNKVQNESSFDIDESSRTGMGSVRRNENKRPSFTADDTNVQGSVCSRDSNKVDNASAMGSVTRSVHSSKQIISPAAADDASINISGSTRSFRHNKEKELSPGTDDASTTGSIGSFRSNIKQKENTFDIDDASASISIVGSIGSIKKKKLQSPDASVGSTAAESMSQSSSFEVNENVTTHNKTDEVTTKFNASSSVSNTKEEETSEVAESSASFSASKSVFIEEPMEKLTMTDDTPALAEKTKKKGKAIRAKNFLKRVLVKKTSKPPRDRPPVHPAKTKKASLTQDTINSPVENTIDDARAMDAPAMFRDVDIEQQQGNAVSNDILDRDAAASSEKRDVSVFADMNNPIKTRGDDEDVIESDLSIISKCDSIGDVTLSIDPLKVEVSLLDMLEDEQIVDDTVEIGCEEDFIREEQHSTKLNKMEPIQKERTDDLRKAINFEEEEFCDLKPFVGSLRYNDSNTNRTKPNITGSELFNCSCGADIKSVIEDTKSTMKEINSTLMKHFSTPLAKTQGNCTVDDTFNASVDSVEKQTIQTE